MISKEGRKSGDIEKGTDGPGCAAVLLVNVNVPKALLNLNSTKREKGVWLLLGMKMKAYETDVMMKKNKAETLSGIPRFRGLVLLLTAKKEANFSLYFGNCIWGRK